MGANFLETEPPAEKIEQAAETLESLGAEWANAPIRYRRDMLQVIFEAVYVDPLTRKLVCVKPYPPFVPLFRMDDWRKTTMVVSTMRQKTKKLDPRVERLLQLILEARRARRQPMPLGKTT